jgi:hypothetical protein
MSIIVLLLRLTNYPKIKKAIRRGEKLFIGLTTKPDLVAIKANNINSSQK